MTNNNECRQAFRAAIQKAATDNPELFQNQPGGDNTPDEVYDMLAGLTADGDGSLLVFLAGREFTAKVLENIPNPDDYEVCALVRDAIEFCISTKDSGGTLSTQNFYTLGHADFLLAAGIEIGAGMELESEAVLNAALSKIPYNSAPRCAEPISYRIPPQEIAERKEIIISVEDDGGVYDVANISGLYDVAFIVQGEPVCPPLVLLPRTCLIVAGDMRASEEAVLTLTKR
jgi:hypothetical protein